MAEFCRKCFIEIFNPTPEEIASIEMSDPDDLEVCEGCMSYGRYVVSIGGDHSEIPDYFDDEEFDEDETEWWE